MMVANDIIFGLIVLLIAMVSVASEKGSASGLRVMKLGIPAMVTIQGGEIDAIEEANTRATAQVEALTEEKARATAQAILDAQFRTAVSRFLASQASTLRGEELDLGLLLSKEAFLMEDNLETRRNLLDLSLCIA